MLQTELFSGFLEKGLRLFPGGYNLDSHLQFAPRYISLPPSLLCTFASVINGKFLSGTTTAFFLHFIRFLFLFFYWNIVDLQCCVGFRYTAKWFSFIYIYIYIYIFRYIYILFQILFPYRLLQNIEYSYLCYTVGPCWLSISCIVLCIC